MNYPINCSIFINKANDLEQKMGKQFTATDGWSTRRKGMHEIFDKRTV